MDEWLGTDELSGFPEEVRQAAMKISKAVRLRSESERLEESWPSGEGRSSAAETAVAVTGDFGGIIAGGGFESLLECPKERSLKRCAICKEKKERKERKKEKKKKKKKKERKKEERKKKLTASFLSFLE